MSSLPSPASRHEQALSSLLPHGSANPLGSHTNQHHLLQAFRSFSRVAGSLERSYLALQTEVGRLRQALAERENELASQVKEKRRERARLNRILGGLPCGVLVVFDNGRIWKANPEALRLLEVDSVEDSDCMAKLPVPVKELLESVRNAGGERELELSSQPGVGFVWPANSGTGCGIPRVHCAFDAARYYTRHPLWRPDRDLWRARGIAGE